jgi:D-glycero-alpha-D-manno-heptose 1-phosphate guanylyltransferase
MIKADFMILCGGLGTRLRAVTGETPKVMAEVQGEPFLDFLIRYLVKQGGRRIILCAGYKAEALKSHYQKKFKDVDLVFSIERQPLGTGGAFKNAQKRVKSEYVFGLNGDCFTPVDYRTLLDFALAKQVLATLVAVRIKGNKDFGTVVMDKADRITAFKEKFATKEVQRINAGVYCFHKSLFERMPSGAFSMEYDLFPRLIGEKFFGFKVDAPFIDIGTPKRFEWAKAHLGEMLK